MRTFSTNLLIRKFFVNEVSEDYLANLLPFDEDFVTRKLGEKNCILRYDST